MLEWMINDDPKVAEFRCKLLIISLQSDKRDYLNMLYVEMLSEGRTDSKSKTGNSR